MKDFDKRKHPRMKRNFFAVFRRLFRRGEPSLPQVGYVRDVSEKGLYFYTQDPPDPQERILLSMYPKGSLFGEKEVYKVETFAKVIRVEHPQSPFPSTDFCGVAVRFANEPVVVLDEPEPHVAPQAGICWL